MKTTIVWIFLLFCSDVFAGAGTVKIIQVINNRHLVVAQGSFEKSIKLGQTFLVNFEDDRQCPVILKRFQNQQYTFDSSSCDREDKLKKNLEIEPALVEGAGVPAEASEGMDDERSASTERQNSRRMRFGISAHYNFADTIKFTETIGSDVTFNTRGASGLGVKVAFLEENSWGFIASIENDFNRSLNSVYGADGLTSFTSQPKFSFFLLEISAAYRWGVFYLPFGLNYSVPNLSNAGGDKLIGTLGAVMGVGFFIQENASIEALLRGVGLRFKDSQTDGIFGTGYLTGLVLNANYWF